MNRVDAACEGEEQERDKRDGQNEEQVGQSPFQRLHANPPRPEQDFVEVENPKGEGDAE
jgi:hypothetical protein